MIRVYVVVEGSTEESFINNLLAPFLWSHSIHLTPIILGPSGHKGGRTSYARVKKDVMKLLKQDKESYCSTMLDFYGLGPGFPGAPLAPGLPNREKVTRIEEAVKADIISALPRERADTRFLSYLQLHEFEALLFSDPASFASGIGEARLASQFQSIRSQFATPEDIDDGPTSAPSKRVLAVHQSYRKVVDGTLAAQAVSVRRMRDECPHFRDWVDRLTALGVT